MLLTEIKRPSKFSDIDDVREYLQDLASAADIWMGEPDLEKLLKHLQAGGKVKTFTIDASRAEDKHEAWEIADKKIDRWKAKGWFVLGYEWDGDGESLDVVMTDKDLLLP